MSPRKETGQASIFCAEDSPARTCPPRVSESVLGGGAPACGTTSRPSSGRSGRNGSSSKTLHQEPRRGCVQYDTNCTCSVIERAPWGLPPQTSARLIAESACSLLPTLTASSYGSNIGGAAGRVGKERPSSPTMAKRGLLPTLTATANLLSPSMQKWAGHRRLLQTLTARDEKGPGPTHTKSGVDLPQVIGGHLSPTFCEWYMGFPEGWTDLGDASRLWVMPWSLNARKP
jgi:hypothetical protein